MGFNQPSKLKNIQGGGSYDFNMFRKQVNIVQDTWIWSILLEVVEQIPIFLYTMVCLGMVIEVWSILIPFLPFRISAISLLKKAQKNQNKNWMNHHMHFPSGCNWRINFELNLWQI
jgi:hypothetical protein